MKMKFSIHFFIILFSVSIVKVYSQQDPHYTQYMYNTMSINPAYAGFKEYAFISALARTQWVGLEGAPKTQGLSFDSSMGSGIGLGINIMNDELGPSKQISVDANISYTIDVSNNSKLALGLRLGGGILDVDWSRGRHSDIGDPVYTENIYKVLPIIGSGVYFYKPEEWYIGVSTPNLLRSESYQQYSSSVEVASKDKLHIYTILGYVFTVNEDIKFKPASLIKTVSGAPLSIDVSANFYLYEKVNAGISWRLDDSISASIGFRVTDSLLIGYAYDATTSNYSISNTGTHEILLQYQFFGIAGPRRLGCF